MNKEDIQEASKILFEHRLNKTGLSSLKNLAPQSIDEAYAIQDNLKLRYLELKDNTCIGKKIGATSLTCLLYTSPSPRDGLLSRMPSSA